MMVTKCTRYLPTTIFHLPLGTYMIILRMINGPLLKHRSLLPPHHLHISLSARYWIRRDLTTHPYLLSACVLVVLSIVPANAVQQSPPRNFCWRYRLTYGLQNKLQNYYTHNSAVLSLMPLPWTKQSRPYHDMFGEGRRDAIRETQGRPPVERTSHGDNFAAKH